MTPSLSCIKPVLLIAAPALAIWLAQRRWQLWQRARLSGLALAVWLLSLLPVAQIGFAAAIMALAAGGRADLAGVRYANLIQAAAATHNLDPALVAAVVESESNFNAQAVSPVGAMGLMQIMPGTAAEWGLLDPFDAAANLDTGAAYLAWLLDRYGDESLALAAYNAGPGRVDACQCIPANGETPGYVVKVIAAAERYRQPNNSPILPYGPDVTPRLTDDNPNPIPFKGQDWATPCGTPLYAPITGVVTALGFDGYVGRYGSNNSYIIINDGAGTEVILLHGRYVAQVGQAVVKGQTLIGYEASIGNSTGCHTDYSVRRKGD